ncbi:MAG TPA: adenosine deaminase [Granulicella sp.]|nr:adenosine deaminase [Granulicella sp.]
MLRALRLGVLCCLAVVSFAHGSTGSAQTARNASRSDLRAARAFDAAKQSPPELHAFLERMPKGADLHIHLSGAVYAETFLRDARQDRLCVNPTALDFVKNIGTTRTLPVQPVCPEGTVPAADAFKNQKLYDALVDSFSMRSFVPSAGVSGHDQFFATFARFGGLNKDHAGEWLDEVATRAAAQNEQYLEIMQTPSFSLAAKLGAEMGWPATTGPAVPEGMDVTGTTPAELSQLRERLLAAGLRDEVAANRAEFDDALAARRRIEHCGQPDAAAACSVKIRFLYQILRANSPQQVFAQTLLGFEVASVDPDVVGLNFVQPEDAYLAMSEYSRQMRMLDYLHSVYPSVHISLHAGELAPGMVPPAGLRFHIREAVDLGHAERIGHGVDIMYEDDPHALLREMASRHVMVEINLTSNDVILGISGNRHPLPTYLAAHVPVALSTDDEGVSRIDLTNEYTRAALEFHLTYPQLKDMARTGIEHSFLPGEDLWKRPDQHTAIVAACASDRLGAEDPRPACTAFLKANDKAAEQWELERRFQVFESTLP